MNADEITEGGWYWHRNPAFGWHVARVMVDEGMFYLSAREGGLPLVGPDWHGPLRFHATDWAVSDCEAFKGSLTPAELRTEAGTWREDDDCSGIPLPVSINHQGPTNMKMSPGMLAMAQAGDRRIVGRMVAIDGIERDYREQVEFGAGRAHAQDCQSMPVSGCVALWGEDGINAMIGTSTKQERGILLAFHKWWKDRQTGDLEHDLMIGSSEGQIIDAYLRERSEANKEAGNVS